MDYFFIYSAGGGGGEWNGLKRVWKEKMPETLKSNILLKFGDVFFNHASLNRLIKPQLWKEIHDLRKWLFDAVQDEFVNEKTVLLLDSGTAKVVNQIKTNKPNITPDELAETFQKLFTENQVLDKYVEIIQNSKINYAVTFDIPNPFKIRTQSADTRTNIFDATHSSLMIEISADYANELYKKLGKNQERILTIVNGLWSKDEVGLFFKRLNYKPNKFAVGGLTRESKFGEALQKLKGFIDFESYEKVHFLGCGGLKNVAAIKKIQLDFPNFSVDNSTAWNRAIDGNTSGTAQSGYFDYASKKLIRIKPETKEEILKLHSEFANPLFSVSEMDEILDKAIQHQSRSSDHSTYNARALLALHNTDVFRINAL
jgi:hypothetical protein